MKALSEYFNKQENLHLAKFERAGLEPIIEQLLSVWEQNSMSDLLKNSDFTGFEHIPPAIIRNMFVKRNGVAWPPHLDSQTDISDYAVLNVTDVKPSPTDLHLYGTRPRTCFQVCISEALIDRDLALELGIAKHAIDPVNQPQGHTLYFPHFDEANPRVLGFVRSIAFTSADTQNENLIITPGNGPNPLSFVKPDTSRYVGFKPIRYISSDIHSLEHDFSTLVLGDSIDGEEIKVYIASSSENWATETTLF